MIASFTSETSPNLKIKYRNEFSCCKWRFTFYYLLRGIWLNSPLAFAGSDQWSRPILVRITVGFTAFTRIFLGPNSKARLLVNESTAAFEALYALWPAKDRCPANDDKFTILDPDFNFGDRVCVTLNTAFMFTLKLL